MSIAPANSNASSLAHVFEGHEIRVQIDERGEPWFCAKDVCSALGYSNSRDAVSRHVDTEDVANHDTLTQGGLQQLAHVNESGIYALIFGSKLDGAKRFKRWVTSEVLPSIRKTGSYTAPAKRAQLSDGTEAAHIALVRAGVNPGIASAAILTVIEQHTGIPMEAARRALPANTETPARLNPTALGVELGITARTVNQRLSERGLQIKNARKEWELTEAGKQYGEAVPFNRNGHSAYQLLWSRDVIEVIR